MAIHPAEEATVRAFFIARKRERFLEILANHKRRAARLHALNRLDYLDPGWIVGEVPNSSAEIIKALRAAGAPDDCHIISDSREIDGRDLPLGDAVVAAHEFSFASILCCLPGRIAFAFGESWIPRECLLLRRPADKGGG